MYLKLMGGIDLALAAMLILVSLGMPVNKIYLVVMLAHALKAMLFIKDVLSLLDLAIVAYSIVLPFWSNPFLTIFAIVLLLYKGAYSFV